MTCALTAGPTLGLLFRLLFNKCVPEVVPLLEERIKL